MIFGWLKRRRRTKLRARPFPDAWDAHLATHVPQAAQLPPTLARKLREDVLVFAAEKTWVGCNGLAITDEIRVTIAANACLLLLGATRPHHYFDGVLSVLVYPDSFRGSVGGDDDAETMGEAWQHGPVILSWSEILDNRTDDRNVVVHEFAHQLDGLDGEMEGIPPLSRQQHERWEAIADREYRELVGRAERGEPSLLDYYGAENRAEFFAVVSECFFERPSEMAREHDELFDWLAQFYRHDPRDWLRDASRGARDEEPEDDAPYEVDGEQFSLGADHDAAFARAAILETTGEYEAALAIYDEVALHDPDDAEVWARRASTLSELERDDEAIDSAHRSIELDDTWADGRRIRARVLVHAGKSRDALADLGWLLRANPEDADALYLRGSAHNDLNEHGRAIADLNRAIKNAPNWADAYAERAAAWRARGDRRRADADQRRAHELDPTIDAAD